MTSLLTATHDPFLPWKHAERTWREARRRGFEVVVVVDDRTSAPDQARVAELADRVFTFTSKGYESHAFVHRCSGDFVLKVDDDEEPSPALWELAAHPPQPARFGIPVLPVLGDQLWRPDVGLSERLFWRDGWTWVGGFEGHSESAAPKLVIKPNPGVVIWHYCLDAPREEREAKAARYEAIEHGDHRARLIYEEHPEDLVPLGELARYLPKEN